jgi:hypothetical protein
MHKRSVKRMTLNKETLRNLKAAELRGAGGDAAAPLEACPTWGPDSCLGACTFNCSWICTM